jgi:uncharacterized membrane protein (UPF0127 family)
MKKIYFLILIVFASASCQINSPAQFSNTKKIPESHYNKSLLVGTKKIYIEVVTTPADMALGLSGRQKLTDEQGMLFDFKTPQPVNFWMKDMLFDLDLIWIKNKKIVGIQSNAPAPRNDESLTDDMLPRYAPPSEVDMVLEVNSGWSERYKITAGNEIKILQN